LGRETAGGHGVRRRLIAAVAFAASGLLAGAAGYPWLHIQVAEAQTATVRAEAKAKLERGAQLLREGEFAQALAQFKEAYDLVPSPKIFFNFGIAYAGLSRYSEALESFERFTDEAKGASPGNLADARQQIETLNGKVEKVQVSSDRDGAEVSIDGRSYGLTPLAHPIYVDPGSHQLIVQDHDRPLIENFTAFAGKEGTLVMRFNAPPAESGPAAGTPNLSASAAQHSTDGAADATLVGTAGTDTGSPEDRRKLHHRLRVASVVGAGVGLACGVTGFILRGVASQKLDAIANDAHAHKLYDPSNGNYGSFDGAGVGLIVGGAAVVGASVVTYLLNRERVNREGSTIEPPVTVSLRAGDSGRFGLILSGRY